jgi:hypothetical protein
MKRLITGFLLMAVFGLAALPASAQQAETPCSPQAPCAKPFLGSGGYGIQLGGEATISSRFDRAYLAPQRYPKAKGLNLIITEKDGKIGFVNREGIETEPPQYKISNFGDGSLIIVEREGKKCAINRHGVRILDCEYQLIYATDRPNVFFVKINGEGRYQTLSGEILNFTQPELEPPPTEPAPYKPLPFAVVEPSELEKLVNAKKWDEAIRTAAASGDGANIRDVLLIFNRTARTSDPSYEAGKRELYKNIGMFPTALKYVGPMEKSELQRLETNIRTWAEGPSESPYAFRGFINASTVGECHRMGGTVTVMRNCAR